MALMADTTPAWREVYSTILDELASRYTGYWAAKDRTAERILLPVLDILQSIPVVTFMPPFILALAYLGFLGFGLQYPTPSWGDMLGNAQQYVASGYWWLVYPVGGCLVAVVLAANLVGDALRDALDVRLRRR